MTALIVDFLNVSIESTKTNLQIFLGAMLFIGPGLIAAIVTKSYKVFFSYIWNVLLLTLGLQIFAAIIGLDQSTQGFLYIIGLGIIAVWKIIDNKPDIETQKFPYTFSTVMVTSMLSVIILVVISDTADKSPESLIQEQIAIVKVRSANIRSGTSTNHKIVGNAKLGDTLKVVSTSNDWLLIEHKNLQGYIHQKLVNNLNTTSKE